MVGNEKKNTLSVQRGYTIVTRILLSTTAYMILSRTILQSVDRVLLRVDAQTPV